jgi:o-succinylbenzoate---CoA ligase
MRFRVLAAARDAGDHTALVLPGGERVSYRALGERVGRVASVLHASGVGPRSRVALWATTREPTLLAILAALELGATLVPVHPRLVAAEAETLIRASTPVRTFLEDDLDELVLRAEKSPVAAALPPPAPRDPLAILFTSGSTGRPKGAILSRAAFLASAAASEKNLGWRDDDAWLLAMPICHVGGLSIVTRCLAARRTVVLHERFDAAATLAAIAGGVTLVSVVPTMLKRLLEADTHNVLSRARAVLVGGAACPPALLEECASRGVLALTTYGLTEACSQVTSQPLRDASRTEPGSGVALDGTEVSIQDGRIHVRGRTMMDGYLDEAPLAQGAWFDTGDLGELDDERRLHVHARRVDLVVTGGENVYPAEIEAALESCPGVRRAFVFGVPDADWGELVACAIERDPARHVAESEIYTSMIRVLATHKRPRRVLFVDALPTVGEKLDRARGKGNYAGSVRPWQKA